MGGRAAGRPSGGRQRGGDDGAPRPFLKWAGGKRQIRDAIVARMPGSIATYFEPFVGGGAVFLELAARRPHPYERAVLADRNRELVNAWRAVRDDVEQVISALEELTSVPVSEERYYAIRGIEPADLGKPEAAARLIYLNRTCYNGLYRVNRSGRFNVPYGRYRSPRILDAANLRAVARVLDGVELECVDFETLLSRARPGDAVYLDPPYSPVSATARFTAYGSQPFGTDEQERLAVAFRDLGRRGVYGLLSNSRVPETERLYAGLPCDVLSARRAINSRGDRRGPVQELLVRTADLPARPGRRTEPPTP